MSKAILAHYGIKYKSGRYPYGSGEDPFQHDGGLRGFVKSMQDKGMKEDEISKMLGMTTREMRQYETIEYNYVRTEAANKAIKLKEKGYSIEAIAKELESSPSTVRSLLDPVQKAKHEKIFNAANELKKELDEKGGYLDIGKGMNNRLQLSTTQFDAAVRELVDKGYEKLTVQVPQAGTKFKTSVEVLCPPGTQYLDVKKNLKDIHVIGGRVYSEDGGTTFKKVEPPVSIDSKRIKIKYAEEGGIEKDGVIEIRPGVEDLSLGNASYVQARIAVDGTHYLKGMCVYNDNLPDGVDIVFNTNKHVGTPMKGGKKDGVKVDGVLKEMKEDPNNPFGATIKLDDELILAQRHYTGKDGKEHLSAVNVVQEEGTWGEWSKTLSSQFLSKQSPQLAKRQLDVSLKEKKDELDEINKVTNPVIRQELLYKFADSCDSAAVDLKGASLPRQQTHVILPFPELKDDEIYAPNYRDGEKVILIRHPHGGIFELPELTVNNHGRNAKNAAKTIGNAKDAVGINSKVAEQLSGADFDGDTAIVIPNNTGAIRVSKPLSQLKGFDAKDLYKVPQENRDPSNPKKYIPQMTDRETQQEMGKISNLITDMTIKGAPQSEIAAAIKHSMVVIDAKKHYLDYKQSFKDNNIAYLKEKWQGGANRGASTIISRASSETRVLERKERGVDPETGEKKYLYTGATHPRFTKKKDGGYEREDYVDELGRQRYRYVKVENGGSYKMTRVENTMTSTKMAETKDAFDLVSGSPNQTTTIEKIYATYANDMKALALASRKDAKNMETPKLNASAAKTYAKEVESLKAKINLSKANKPIERQAQIVADAIINEKIAENPGLSGDALKKEKGKAIIIARQRVGAKRMPVDPTDKEWEAIQAGAVSATTLREIIENSNLDAIKKRAMPRITSTLPASKKQLVKSLAKAGYTQAEIADRLGISESLVSQAL